MRRTLATLAVAALLTATTACGDQDTPGTSSPPAADSRQPDSAAPSAATATRAADPAVDPLCAQIGQVLLDAQAKTSQDYRAAATTAPPDQLEALRQEVRSIYADTAPKAHAAAATATDPKLKAALEAWATAAAANVVALDSQEKPLLAFNYMDSYQPLEAAQQIGEVCGLD